MFQIELWPKVDSFCHKNKENDKNDLGNYEGSTSHELEGLTREDEKPKMVFRQFVKQNSIVFVGQTSLGQTLSVNQYRFNWQYLTRVEKIELEDNLKPLQSFKPSLKLIGVLLQKPRFTDGIYKHIIFFEDKLMIRWCLTSAIDSIKEKV